MTISVAAAPENPLAEGLERLPVAATTFVIFGASGDLSRRKLLPAIYNLAHDGSLPERFEVVGFSRSDLGRDGFRDVAREAIGSFSRTEPDPEVLDGLLERIDYVAGDIDDPQAYERLGARLKELERPDGERPARVFYLSTAPRFFAPAVERLGAAGLAARDGELRDGAACRLVIEKPFGRDRASARELNEIVRRTFDERQVYRIDHYLGKETVQNMLALRFANAMFEPVWNRNFIDNVQITAAEDIGIGSRAGYYDNSGALRDLVQNHMLALLAMLCMEPPASFDAEHVRDEKSKVLQAIRPPTAQDVAEMAVRGRYGDGVVGGEQVPGYLSEPDVPDGSRTETYAAVRLEVDNWRWAGVPFYLRTGKRLARKLTEIAVTLKPVPHIAFQQQGSIGIRPNELIVGVQPDEGVTLSLSAKIPGPRMRIRPVNMEFDYGTSFMSASPEAYERLILDAMRADATLFTRFDQVDAAWGICDPILETWAAAGEPAEYPAGSAGPAEADALLEGDATWRPI